MQQLAEQGNILNELDSSVDKSAARWRLGPVLFAKGGKVTKEKDTSAVSWISNSALPPSPVLGKPQIKPDINAFGEAFDDDVEGSGIPLGNVGEATASAAADNWMDVSKSKHPVIENEKKEKRKKRSSSSKAKLRDTDSISDRRERRFNSDF